MQPASRLRTLAPAPREAFAPGARLLARGELWMARSARPTKTGALEVRVTGLSELVRHREAVFLTDLDPIQPLRPEDTELVGDDSAGYRRSRLYLESLLRQTPPTGSSIYLGHQAAMDLKSYQLVPALKALEQPRPRLLIADAVGLGKTLEVGILLSELIRRGRGRRILVVALKSVLEQFQQELWARFTIPLVRLDTEGLARVQRKIPANNNPFYYFDRVIISVDTLKRDGRYRHYLEQCHWDVTVIDECQHVAHRARPGSSHKSMRANLAGLLARTCDALVMTSATPHDGKPESFASLIQLLEPTAIADESNYTKSDIEHLYVRRFKKDIAKEAEGAFSERLPKLHEVQASPAEEALFNALGQVSFRTLDDKGAAKGILFRTLLLKALLSSPEALTETLEHRLKALERAEGKKATADVAYDRERLNELLVLSRKAEKAGTAKHAGLLNLLRNMGIGPKSKERVVIFSERIRTLEMLAESLQVTLKLPSEAIATFHGTLDDVRQQALVRAFGTEKSPVRVLLASDAASEGINLHYFCHRLIHHDIPWSLIRLEQRNGRIDRFGQKHRPELHYLLTRPCNEQVRGDLRVLDVLIEKEQQAHKNLGDVRWLLKLGTPEEEEEIVATGISQHQPPESFLPDLDSLDLDELFADAAGLDHPPDNDVGVATAVAPSLYDDDLAYWKEALKELAQAHAIEAPEWHAAASGLTLKVPDDLQQRFAYLPPELKQSEHWFLKLSADRALVQSSLAEARADPSRWPEWQLLWPLHPVAEWIDDRVVSSFARHEAPVIRVNDGLAAHESAFVMQGVLSNDESQPVVVDWFAVKFGKKGHEIVALRELAAQVGLHKRLTNDNAGVELAALSKLRPAAVEAAVAHMLSLRKVRADQLRPQLKESLKTLQAWKTRRLEQLAQKRALHSDKGRKVPAHIEQRLRADEEHVERLVRQRDEWIKSRLATSDKPFVRLACVIVARGGK